MNSSRHNSSWPTVLAATKTNAQFVHSVLLLSTILMKTVCAIWKLLRLILRIVIEFGVAIFVYPKLDQSKRYERISTLAHTLLAQLAITLIVKGMPPAKGPVLLASNHISWLDILVILATSPSHFVSKSEVRHWPLVGRLGVAAGTLFIERESRRDAMRVVHHMAERLHMGEVLALFPEGTTSNGVTLLPFHANLFQAAISANAPVLPVALQFSDAATGQISLAPCYVGDDSLLASIWRTLLSEPLCVTVHFGELQWASGRDRRAWAADIRTAVEGLRGLQPPL